MRVLAVTNQKGGTAKSTTAVHVAAQWAADGRRVLLVDLDAQGTASSWVGVPPAPGLAAALSGHHASIADITRNTSIAGLDVVPADPAAVALESLTAGERGRETALRELLRPVARRYDVAVVDCPPTLGLLAVEALAAAHGVLVPVEAKALALPGLAALVGTVERVRAAFHPALHLAGIVLVRVTRTTLARDVEARVREQWGRLVLAATVPESVRLAEAPSFAQPVFDYAPESAGAVAYAAVARELWARWKP